MWQMLGPNLGDYRLVVSWNLAWGDPESLTADVVRPYLSVAGENQTNHDHGRGHLQTLYRVHTEYYYLALESACFFACFFCSGEFPCLLALVSLSPYAVCV